MYPKSIIPTVSLCLLVIFFMHSPVQARTWTSADGSKTFDGNLVAYDAAKGLVTVDRGGSKITFSQSLLSAADITYLKAEGPKLAQQPSPSANPSSGGSTTPVTSVPDTIPPYNGQKADMTKPVQVFLMMGQSNMVGMGFVGPKGKGAADHCLEHYCKDEKKFPFLIDKAGNWVQRKDVRCAMVTCAVNKGWLQPGFGGGRGTCMGPEVGFGWVVGDAIKAPVLLLKACIGNRSLGWDLLPPGSPPYKYGGKMVPGYRGTPEDPKGSGQIPTSAKWYAGKQWDIDTTNAHEALNDIGMYYPGASKYKIAGIVFWQGDKDRYDAALASHYEENMVRFIKTVRKEFNCPDAKFVLATLGQTAKGASGNEGDIIKAQLDVDGNSGKYPEFKGNVATVYSHPLSLGGASSGHYNRDACTYMNIGEAMGRAMVKLLAGN